MADFDLFAELFDASPVGVTVSHFPVDEPGVGVLLAANAAASRTIGVDLTPFIGMAMRPETFHGDFDPDEMSILRHLSLEVATTGRARQLEAFEVVHGPIRGIYQASVFPLGGRRVATIFRRVDAVIEAGRSLEWAMQTMESTDDQVARFAASIAHDLKNPLAGISGNAELLAMMSDSLPAEARAPVERIRQLAALSAQQIDGFVDLARRPPAAENAPVDLAEVVAWVESVMEDELDVAGAELLVGPLPLVGGHPAALRQVVLNLVANSVRYRHPDRPLVITVRASDDLGMEVADNGLGIAPEDRDRVFDWGFRGDQAATRPGTGFGLAACRAVLARLGAEITIGPEPLGGGTAIMVQFAQPL